VKTHPNCLRIGDLSQQEKDAATALKEEDLIDVAAETEEEKLASQEKASKLKELMKSTNISLSDPDRDKELGPDPSVETKKRNKKGKGQTTIAESTEGSKLLAPSYFPDAKKDESKDKLVDDPILKEEELKDEEVDIKPNVKDIVTKYDPLARNPSYAGAELVLAHELMAMAQHFHPSVALFAQSLISKKPIKYDGNPLKDFTLSRFLERFVYRNAKVNKSKRPEYQPQGLRNVPVNSESYLKAGEDSIPPEERFFYKFFTKKTEETVTIKKEKDDDNSDAESVGDDEFDDLMKNYFKSVKGGDDSDDDEEVDDEEGDVDFAAGIESSGGKTKGKKGKKALDEDDDDEEDDELEEDSDEEGDDADDFIEMDEEDDEDDDDDFDEDEMEGDDDMFGDEDDDEMMQPKVCNIVLYFLQYFSKKMNFTNCGIV
jgi:hypothetical protein